MNCDRNEGKGVCWQEWRNQGFTTGLPAAINFTSLKDSLSFCTKGVMTLTSFVQPSTKRTLKKIVLLSNPYVITTFFFFLMSHWKSCIPRCKTNRACNRKTDKILLKNLHRLKSPIFKGNKTGTINVTYHSLKRPHYLYTTKPPGETMLHSKIKLNNFLAVPFLFGRKMCLGIPISYPENTFITFLEFRHLRSFSYAMVWRDICLTLLPTK